MVNVHTPLKLIFILLLLLLLSNIDFFSDLNIAPFPIQLFVDFSVFNRLLCE
jgi:hypothetical protein